MVPNPLQLPTSPQTALRKIGVIICVCGLLGAPPLVAVPGDVVAPATDRPGEDLVLTTRTTNEGTFPAPMPVLLTKMSIKGKMARIDMSFESSPGPRPLMDQSTINLADSGEAIFLFHHTKTYQRFTKEMQEASRQDAIRTMQQQGGLPTARPALSATGRTMEINGQVAKEYQASNQTQDLTYWVVDSGEFRTITRVVAEALASPTSNVYGMRFPDPGAFEGYAVRMEIGMEMPGGHKVTSVTSLQEYEWTTLSLDLFSPPADYTEVQAQPAPPAPSQER